MSSSRKRPASSHYSERERRVTVADLSQQLEAQNYTIQNLVRKVDQMKRESRELPRRQKEMCFRMEAEFKSQKKMIEALEKKLETKDEKKESKIELFPAKEKKFVLRETFKNVSTAAEGVNLYGKAQSFFGYDWKISIKRQGENLGVFLSCFKSRPDEEWSVATNTTYRILNGNEITTTGSGVYGKETVSLGYKEFMKWHQVLGAAVNDEINVEVDVTITKMTGTAKPKARSFDENQREFADVVLTAGGEDFYVLKKFLASKSAYFNSMFFSNFIEADKDQIDLPFIDPTDFQSFLEVLHGEHTIDDESVEGILLLSDFYLTPTVTTSCEKYLLFETRLSSEKKFQLGIKYNLMKLTKKCIDGMNNIEEILSVMYDELSSEVRKMLKKRVSQIPMVQNNPQPRANDPDLIVLD